MNDFTPPAVPATPKIRVTLTSHEAAVISTALEARRRVYEKDLTPAFQANHPEQFQVSALNVGAITQLIRKFNAHL